eukprot:scaffold14343_cov99-Isochrysis_galbana.AAC.3
MASGEPAVERKGSEKDEEERKEERRGSAGPPPGSRRGPYRPGRKPSPGSRGPRGPAPDEPAQSGRGEDRAPRRIPHPLPPKTKKRLQPNGPDRGDPPSKNLARLQHPLQTGNSAVCQSSGRRRKGWRVANGPSHRAPAPGAWAWTS